MNTLVTSLVAVLATSSLVVAQNSGSSSTCFFPAGNIADNNVPCNPNAGVSHCCSKTSQCLDNGLCKVNTDDDTVEFARGACTDQTWQSPECFQHCKSSQPGSPASNGAAVFECGTVGFLNPASYCCENGINHKTSCCSTSSLLFQLGPGSTTYGGMSSTSLPAPATTPTVIPTSSSSSAAASSESTIVVVTETSSAAVTGTESSSMPLGTATTSFSFGNSSTPSTATLSSSSIPIATGAAAGGKSGMVGVSASLGIAIVAVGMALL